MLTLLYAVNVVAQYVCCSAIAGDSSEIVCRETAQRLPVPGHVRSVDRIDAVVMLNLC